MIPFSIYIYAAAALLFAGLGGTAYVYKLKYDKAQIKQEVAEDQVKTILQVNKNILEIMARDAEVRRNLNEKFQAARKEAEEYKAKIASHDLAKLANAKPGLITNRARAATDRVLRQIESAANRRTGETVSEPTNSGQDQPQASPADSNGD